MCVDKWILTLGVLAIGILGRAEAYTNQWAAHIDGGPRIARQVARDHGFRYRREVIGRLYSPPTSAWTHAKCSSVSVINRTTVHRRDSARPNSSKQSMDVRSSGESPGPIGSSRKKSSFPLDSTTKFSPYRQSLRLVSIPISFPSRPFSHLSSRAIKVTREILGDPLKRLDSSDSSGKDRYEERAIGNVEKKPKELDKPRAVSRDSCKPETSPSSSSEIKPKREAEAVFHTCSQNRSNLPAAGHDSSKLPKTSRPVENDDPPDENTGLFIDSSLSARTKSHESHMSYVDKMQECFAPRLRERKNRSPENTRPVADDRGSSSRDDAGKWKSAHLTTRRMIIGDWYHLEHRSVKRRSTEPHLEVHRRLTADSRVRRAEQQRAKSRPKRDLVVKRPPSMQMIFNDRRWPEMWYLNRGNGLDMNVQEAWAEGITGKGIVVTILDDGLEKDHPDLLKNYDPEASYDVNDYDDDPMPRYDIIDSNRHGTRCAGEVAATPNNSICSVGVAYGASVGGVRMLDGDVTDAVEAKSLSLYPHHIDIYSASWGPDDDGKTVDGPGELATRAFNEGVTKGRKGKGSIFVWASGNGGRDHDNCNCDGYTNSIWTLSISSATENGLVPWYSEACSSTLATTYSSGSIGEKQVVTTDLHHKCTSSHTGTSASAPLAAGICALALEANPELTWRDMQHIVVRTAKPANLKAPDWVTNGVGRNVSHSFGYGLMDAAAMVRLARKWRTVPEQQKCEVSAPHSGRQIPPRSQLILELHVKECTGVNFLEHVQAKVSLMASRRGDLQIQLTSPQGTKSTLLAKRPHDISKAGFNQWPFMSVHTWGERPHGTWKLEIHNEGRYLGRATLHEWALIFYGTSTMPDRTEYALYSPAGVTSPARRPFVKTRESAATSKNALLVGGGYGPKAKTTGSGSGGGGGGGGQHGKSAKIQTAGGIAYSLNSSASTAKKSKARGQHKNGKSANRGGSSRPTAQTLRGLTSGRVGSSDSRGNLPTVKSRPRSTASPARSSTTRIVVPTTGSATSVATTRSTRLRISENPTVAPFQRALVLVEPPPPKASTNRVPVVFLQYPKIQQLYPLYPIYGGARGAGPERPPGRPKGLDLLQDQQFDNGNLQFADKGTLEEWNMVFYGTDKSLEIDDELDRDKEYPRPLEDLPEVVNDNKAPAYGGRPNIVDSDGVAWTGSQKVDQISHPEVQRPTTENQTSGACIRGDAQACLECEASRYLYEGRCVAECPAKTYPARDERTKVCSICHYTCASCGGASNTECTSCHADATLVSTRKGDSQCVQKSLEWKSQSTVWFYRMSIIFGINLGFLIAGAVYLCVTFVKRTRHERASGHHYDYNKLLSPEDDDEAAIMEKRSEIDRCIETDACPTASSRQWR